MDHVQKIPKCMSSQHPDNVIKPFFSSNDELMGEDEIQEAYYAFSHFHCDEQMWDYEGKEADCFVVRKLLAKYEKFFKEKRLGEDIFLTFRLPNPEIEKSEAKILLEILESIPRSFDTSKMFYGDRHPPIFEVILSMTTSAESINRIYRYYADVVIGKASHKLSTDDITISDWIGEFQPSTVHVIPLFEDKAHLLEAHTITKAYIKDKNLSYQRVFLARSDPAMNYGFISAVLLNKIALKNLDVLTKETGITVYPVIGLGSAPFRGNLRPQTVGRILDEYPSVHTFSVQSAFKYDHTFVETSEAIHTLCSHNTGRAHNIDIEKSLIIIDRYSSEYQRQMIKLVPIITRISKCIPKRRKRKIHTGLFGYVRKVEDLVLPRAISFTCALYSIGVPPEVLGLSALREDDFLFLKENYVHFEDDMKDALRYANLNSPFLPLSLKKNLERFSLNHLCNDAHKEITDHILSILEDETVDDVEEYILRAARIRNFLG